MILCVFKNLSGPTELIMNWIFQNETNWALEIHRIIKKPMKEITDIFKFQKIKIPN
jgi:hypothetical protein